MKAADLHPGQVVAVAPELEGEHLVFILGIDDGDRGRMVEGWHFGIAVPDDAGAALRESLTILRLRLTAEGFPAVVASEMNRHPAVARLGGHRGVVRDVNVPLGRKRGGVLVNIDLPADDPGTPPSSKTWARELLKGLRTVAVVVPPAMLRDYDQLRRDQERRTIDLRSPGSVSRFGGGGRFGTDLLRFALPWSRAGGV